LWRKYATNRVEEVLELDGLYPFLVQVAPDRLDHGGHEVTALLLRGRCPHRGQILQERRSACDDTGSRHTLLLKRSHLCLQLGLARPPVGQVRVRIIFELLEAFV
jgi:hypothetical protein